jgi:hypothetical protein
MNPVNILIRHVIKIHFNIILHLHLGISNGLQNFRQGDISGSHGDEYEDGCLLGCCAIQSVDTDRRFKWAYHLHHQGDYYSSVYISYISSVCYKICRWVSYQLWCSLLCNFLHSPVICPLIGPNILLITQFWNTQSSLRMKDQVSHTQPSVQRISVILIMRIKQTESEAGALPSLA